MAVCYSTGEYCSAVWSRSAHAAKINSELNRACQTITGTLKATPLPSLYRLAGIPPPAIRREAFTKAERDKQISDSRHPLYGHEPVPTRLPSRHSFMTVTGLGVLSPGDFRLARWGDTDVNNNAGLPEISESLPSRTDLPQQEWVTLNRARAKVARTGDNLVRWAIEPSAECPCGDPNQTLHHLQHECPLGPRVSDEDLKEANDTARRWIERWRDKL